MYNDDAMSSVFSPHGTLITRRPSFSYSPTLPVAGQPEHMHAPEPHEPPRGRSAGADEWNLEVHPVFRPVKVITGLYMMWPWRREALGRSATLTLI